MEQVEVDAKAERILVRFGDGKQGWIPVDEIKEFSSGRRLIPITTSLPNPHEIEIETRDGISIKIPWDFARHYCDPSYKRRELDRFDS